MVVFRVCSRDRLRVVLWGLGCVVVVCRLFYVLGLFQCGYLSQRLNECILLPWEIQ